MPHDPDLELVAAHDAFVRRLARTLISDAGRAEDLAQDTWVAALGAGPKELRQPRGWLAAAMRGIWSNGLRSEARRAQRELQAARPEAAAPHEDLLVREESRRALVDALGALPEPYRDCLVLRYFEGLPPRRIARRLGVPVETVKTRLKRGREQLAARLDWEFDGGRRAWALALLPLARPTGQASLSMRALAEVAIMSSRTKLLLGTGAFLGLILATALGVLALRDGGPASPAPAAARTDVATALEADAPSRAHEMAPPGPAPERAAAPSAEPAPPAAPAPTRGSLSVLVLSSDEKPASGVRARVYPWSGPSPAFHAVEATTDEQGRFFVGGLPPGRVGIYSAQGASERAAIEPGAVSEVTLRLSRGFDVLGEVVDGEGAPLAGADIWLSNMGPSSWGFVVGSSDAHGRFRIASVDGLSWVGARAPCYAPSVLQTVAGGTGAEVPLRLVLDQRAGQVRGRVFDPAGEPVAGALVLAGSFERLRTAKGDWVSGPVRAVTDAQGAYELRTVAPGELDLAVRADGLAAWRGRLAVFEGGVSQQDVYLLAGANVVGTVRSDGDSPAEDIEISVEVWEELSYSTRSAPDGSYRLDNLPPGEIELRADGEARGRATAMLDLADGETREWSLTLGTGLALAGRVVDESENPLAGWTVELTSSGIEVGSFRHDRVTSDAGGRFRFLDCSDQSFEVTASAPHSFFPSATLTGQRPPRDDLVLRARRDDLPTARITGAVLTQDGRPAAAASVTLASSRYMTSPVKHPDEEAGLFAFEALPPGVWRVGVTLAGVPPCWSEAHDLQPGESWDAGTLTIGQQGTFRARLVRGAGTPSGVPKADLQFDGYPMRDVLAVEEEEIRAGPLAPGRYTLDIVAKDIAASRSTIDVLDGEETVVEILLRPGFPARITVDLGSSHPEASHGRLALVDASGATVSDTWIWLSEQRTGRQDLWLAPCPYRVEFRLPDGSTLEGLLEVIAGGPQLAELDLRL